MKKKVAFCMRGAVAKEKAGHFLCKNDLYTDSKYVNYKQCYNSIIKHIIEPNAQLYDIDIFQHCWNPDLENDLVELYKPKAYLFEDNNDYSDEISELCMIPGDFGGISHSLSIKKSIEVKEKYERENNITYDIVILYRYDILLWKDMILHDYNIDNFYVSAINFDISPSFMWGNGDFHFVMNNSDAKEFKYLYDSLKNNNPHRGHYWMKNYVTNYMKKPVYEDSILCGKNQEVLRRIIENSINLGYLDMDKFLSYL